MVDNFKGIESKVVFEWLRFVEVERVGKGDQLIYECQPYDIPYRYNTVTVKALPGARSRRKFSMTDVTLGVGVKCLGMLFVKRQGTWTVNRTFLILVHTSAVAHKVMKRSDVPYMERFGPGTTVPLISTKRVSVDAGSVDTNRSFAFDSPCGVNIGPISRPHHGSISMSGIVMAIYQSSTQSNNGGGFKGVNVGADMRGIG